MRTGGFENEHLSELDTIALEQELRHLNEKKRREFYANLKSVPLDQVEAYVSHAPAGIISWAEVEQIKASAKRLLDQRIAAVQESVRKQADQRRESVSAALDEMDNVERALADLVAEAESGQLDYPEFKKQHDELRQRFNRAQRPVAEAAAALEDREDPRSGRTVLGLLSRAEEPLAYLKQVGNTYPHLSMRYGGYVPDKGGLTPRPEEPQPRVMSDDEIEF